MVLVLPARGSLGGHVDAHGSAPIRAPSRQGMAWHGAIAPDAGQGKSVSHGPDRLRPGLAHMPTGHQRLPVGVAAEGGFLGPSRRPVAHPEVRDRSHPDRGDHTQPHHGSRPHSGGSRVPHPVVARLWPPPKQPITGRASNHTGRGNGQVCGAPSIVVPRRHERPSRPKPSRARPSLASIVHVAAGVSSAPPREHGLGQRRATRVSAGSQDSGVEGDAAGASAATAASHAGLCLT